MGRKTRKALVAELERRLARKTSIYVQENLDGEMDEWRISVYMLRWLTDEGFLKKSERRFFGFKRA